MSHRGSSAGVVARSLAILSAAALGACSSSKDVTATDACATRTATTVGASVNGSLVTGDCVLGGILADRYSVALAQQASVRITATSGAIDPVLSLYDAQSRLIVTNDDSANTTTTASIRALLAPGTYYVDATSFATGETGAYSLAMTGIAEGVHGCRNGDFGDGIYITPGVTTTQQIEAGDCAVSETGGAFLSDRFILVLPANQSVTIRMTSTAVDPYLTVINGSANPPYPVIAQNDNGGGGTTAQVTIASTGAARTLVIDAGTANINEAGAYTLSVQP